MKRLLILAIAMLAFAGGCVQIPETIDVNLNYGRGDDSGNRKPPPQLPENGD